MKTMNSKALIAASGLAILAGCTDPAYMAGGERQRTAQGAAAGAVAGALIGGTRKSGDGRLRRAAVGAALGAAAGAAVGTVLDRQAAELRSELDSDIGVINTGNELIVRMPQDILFATNSATVAPALRADLFSLADNLQRYPDSTITVVGHTDNTGSAAYNQDLSENRAQAVASILIGAGVPSYRIRTIGAGENQPIASNSTAADRAKNRRVDITIRPNS